MVSDSHLKPVLSLVKKEKNKDFTKFAEVYLAALGDEDVQPYSSEDLLRILKELWNFMEVRKPGSTNIEITSPLNRKLDWDNQKTSIFIATKERPFLIDSVAAEIIRHNLRIFSLMHPMISVKRDEKTHKRLDVSDNSSQDFPHESILFIEVEGSLSQTQCETLKADILSVLDDVRYATNDWLDMKAKVLHCMGDLQKASPCAPAELQKYLDFLQYIYDDNFTLLGYREYDFSRKKGHVQSKISKDSGLGLLHDDKLPAYITDCKSSLAPEFQDLRVEQDIITISKVSRNSTVHRPVPLDGIHIKIFDKKGEVCGEKLFIGLFTSVTYSRSVRDVPLLRDKVADIIEMCNFTPNSHDYKALTHILEKYPRDELFQIEAAQLAQFVTSILRLQERPRVALFTRQDPFKRYISCLVYIPRDTYSTNIRELFQGILADELNGSCSTFYTTLDDSPLARVLFIVKTDQDKQLKYNENEIEQKLIEAGRPWDEKLLQTLIEEEGEIENSFELGRIYGSAFPSAYIDEFSTSAVIKDIHKMEDVYCTGSIGQSLYRPEGMSNDQLRLKVYNPKNPIPLSDVIPIMENMGLGVQSELPFEVKPKERDNVIWIHDFLMTLNNGNCDVDAKDVKENFENALHHIWYKNAEDDSLNALIVSANMPWRDIVILRGYTKYLRQANFPHTPDYIIRALTDFPEIAKILVEWFKAKFDPANFAPKGTKAKDVAKCLTIDEAAQAKINKIYEARIEKALNDVTSLDQDKILRSFGILIKQTLRTNFFQNDEQGKEKTYVSYKLNSKEIYFLPMPRPDAEVFVYSPRMEGVHLRGGKIARGGIRWSDRHEDFRTEILGLMKAQMVKNSVIVPVGAKGGFIVKNPPKGGDRQAFFNEGVECYKLLIRGLLDITDNLRGGNVIAPREVVRFDVDDPYLVVAADKGTATFSDIANSLSEEYDFWLSDAFASGGSAGYDHKAMGITARGAWESVKRHFRELGKDIQSEEFEVIGVGDMGGDVFGNGMLLSEHIKLVGAFNHLHIFCDPSPDAKKTFKERKRLFENVKGWGDYNEKLLSKGGRIYDRSEKSLKLTKEIKAKYGIKADEVSPIELIRAMLKTDTDLLWFGGIGTYIKASSENHHDVGDKANDALRINAKEVNAKVIGEGANLGITQQSRIEMGRKGIRLNADFIDNAGGVDCSDHEVNIKIMFSQFMRAHEGKLSMAKRNKILEKMTDRVAEQVLENNYQQSQAISLAQKTTIDDLRNHNRLISHLEKHNGLDRELETLPNDEEILQRGKEGKGLTRPEIATLIAYCKIRLYNMLLDSDVPDSSLFDEWLISYFPEDIQKDYKESIQDHRLRREIVATRLTNTTINRFGPGFVFNLEQKTDALPHQVARSSFFVRETFGFKKLWTEIEQLDNKAPADIQLEALLEIKKLAEHATMWLLNRCMLDGECDVHALSKSYADGYAALKDVLGSKDMPKTVRNALRDGKKRFVRNDLPEALAEELSLLPFLRSSCDITYLALQEGFDAKDVAQIYYAVGEKLDITWLHEQATGIYAGNKWQENVLQTIRDELYDIHAEICEAVLKSGKNLARDEKIASWMDMHKRSIESLQKMVVEMKGQSNLDISMLSVAEHRLRRLAQYE
jgi:glutamate dehydrogenase